MTEASGEITDKLKTKEKPVRSAAVIIIKDGQLLTVRHKAGTTAGEGVSGFPGGRVREGESEAEAAARELQEETGLIAPAGALVEFPGNFFRANLNLDNGHPKPVTMRVFICNSFEGELRADALGTEPEWVSLAQINKGLYETPPNVLEAIKGAQDFLKQT